MRHVDEQQVPEAALGRPTASRSAAAGVKRWLRLTPKQRPRSRATAHHLLGLGDVVADRLLAQHVAAGLQRLERRQVVVAAVLVAAGGDAAHVGLERRQHLGRVVEATARRSARRPPRPAPGGCRTRPASSASASSW